MKPTEALPKRGDLAWSHRLQQRYALRLDESLADWFDSGAWQHDGYGEFNQTVAPEILLAETPEVLWPGLMLPDTLPVLGNRYGDWLCLRVGPDNAVQEIIHWYHGGGDWIPWGKTLAEAIIFDSVRDALPGRWQDHAVPAEPRRRADGSGALAQWAAGWLPTEVSTVVGAPGLTRSVAVLLEHGVSEVALRCELVLAALDSGLRRVLSPEIAAEMGIRWEPDAVSWLFDTSLMDEDCRLALRRHVGAAIEFDQDWSTAAAHAAAVCQQRDDLGWAFDIAGWAAEREGDLTQAAGFYRRGAMTLAFADQAIRFRTHWFPQGKGKFAIWRLDELESADGPGLADGPGSAGRLRRASDGGPVDRYLHALHQAEPCTFRAQAVEYWQGIARDAVEQGRWADAYDAHYRAGWDLGLDDMSGYQQQLVGLVEAAERSGQTGRARIAQAHLDTFIHRFG